MWRGNLRDTCSVIVVRRGEGAALGQYHARSERCNHTIDPVRSNEAMGIFSRLGTLIKSNINDLITKAEDPEKMLSQVLLEMQQQLVEAKKAVAVAIAVVHRPAVVPAAAVDGHTPIAGLRRRSRGDHRRHRNPRPLRHLVAAVADPLGPQAAPLRRPRHGLRHAGPP